MARMCGRYSLSTPNEVLAEVFSLAEPPALQPRWNIAPTQMAPVVRRSEDGARRLDLLRWGLVPPWADDPRIGARMINARVETVATKPAFRQAFRSRRCLVPADAFYEWLSTGSGKQPFRVRRPDARVFAMAGLWERARGLGGEALGSLETFTILTTGASDAVRPIHDRMPLILPPDAWDAWLDPALSDAARLRALIEAPDAADVVVRPVDRAVNDPRNDDPRCAAEA